MALDTTLIMLLCAGCTYWLLGKTEKKLWKILAFLGVWFAGFVVTLLAGIYVSAELHDGEMAIMNRYFGNSIPMPLMGCWLGTYLKKLAVKRAGTSLREEGEC